jgi:transcriptional regulator with GAF, ATPase, and Fis domain
MPEVDDRILRTLIELSDAATAHDDVAAVLTLLARRAVALLAVTCCAVATADANGRLSVLGSSDERAGLLGRIQLEYEAGPLVSSYRSAAVVECGELADVAEWRRCAQAAIPLGIHTAYTVPLQRGENVLGSATLFGAAGELPRAAAREAVLAMAASATVGILTARAVRRAESDSAHWRTALARRILIEQASGVLAERGRIPVDEARQDLEIRARAAGVASDELARRILSTVRNDDGEDGSGDGG